MNFENPQPRFESERLLLRLPRADDADELTPIYADPEVMRYIGDGATRNREQVEAGLAWMIQQHEQFGYGLWIVVRKSTARVIGRCGLIRQLIEDTPEVELAYLLESGSWGEGLATEAALAIRQQAAQVYHISRLISLIHPDNQASKRVALKAGLGFEKNVDLSGKPAEMYSTAEKLEK